jgi:hypothetical protein
MIMSSVACSGRAAASTIVALMPQASAIEGAVHPLPS